MDAKGDPEGSELDSSLIDDLLKECEVTPSDVGQSLQAGGDGSFVPYGEGFSGPGGLDDLCRSWDHTGVENCEVDTFDVDLHNFLFGNTLEESGDLFGLLDDPALGDVSGERQLNEASCPFPAQVPPQEPPQDKAQLGQTQPVASSSGSKSTQGNVGQSPAAKRKGRAGGKLEKVDNAEDPEAERKRKARQQRNRENAHNSRQRKKMYLDQLETKCRALESENYRLKLENAALKHQLATAFQSPGQFPTQPQVQGQGYQPPWPIPQMGSLPPCAPSFAGSPGIGNFKLPLWPVPEQTMSLQGDGADKVEASTSKDSSSANGMLFSASNGDAGQKPRSKGSYKGKSKQLLPETVDSNSSQDSGGPMDLSSGSVDAVEPSSKKQKLIALASSVAMLCLVLGLFRPGSRLLGTLSHPSLPHPSGGAVRHLHSLMGLPARASIEGDRSLVSVDNKSVNNEGKAMGDVDRGGESLEHSGSGNWTDRNFSLQFPGDKMAEDLALKKLKELGPMAVLLSDSDFQPPNHRGPLKSQGWNNFTQLMSEVFSTSGFHPPSTCQEVFRFDASLVDDMEEARRKLQRQVMTMALYKGFPVGPLPLPPAGDWEEIDQGGSRRDGWNGKRVESGSDNDTGVIVSVFIPAQGNVEKLGMLTAVKSVFVVVLKPLATYLTFSCPLSIPMFA